jgi:hypothetical protein
MMRIVTLMFVGSILAITGSNISVEKDRSVSMVEEKACRTVLDSLTMKTIYCEVDKNAENEGGEPALMRQFAKITLDSIPEDLDTKVIIAFIVDENGRIFGERVVKDKTNAVGQKMIRIVKSFKWKPAECKGNRVPAIVKLPLQICFSGV